jgi:hypothetical protein
MDGCPPRICVGNRPGEGLTPQTSQACWPDAVTWWAVGCGWGCEPQRMLVTPRKGLSI